MIGVISEAASSLVQTHHDLIARLVSERKRFENWMQLQILERLMPEYPALEIEKPYPDGKERCDFWSRAPGAEQWLELKLCVTNYCAAYTGNKSARPITNQISEIARDLEKLRRIPSDSQGYVLLLAYPLPIGEPEHPNWADHLGKLSILAANSERAFSVELHRNGQQAALNAYVFQALEANPNITMESDT